MQVVIVGAGVFGASLAWRLAAAGHAVTLVDQFEPGDARASSGGETRLLRCVHGPDGDYTAMARRARTLWRELEAEAGVQVLLDRGIAWFADQTAGWEADAERTLTEQQIPVEHLDPDEARSLFPTFRSDDLEFVLFEPEAGVLRAECAVRTLTTQAAHHGARVVRSRARPRGATVVLVDGQVLEGDAVVWACGPWLAKLFPDLVSLSITCQELLFFDGGPPWRCRDVPGWCDYDLARYGTSDIDEHGVKVAIDEEGPPIDPDADLPTEPTTEEQVRGYLRLRFPALEHAALVSARCCRYEITRDTHFIAAPHPGHSSVWLVGGGSGHGFKHGPAMAELLASAIGGHIPVPERFRLGAREPGRSLRTAGSGAARPDPPG